MLNFHCSESLILKIVRVRLISRVFFFAMFVWFCEVIFLFYKVGKKISFFAT